MWARGGESASAQRAKSCAQAESPERRVASPPQLFCPPPTLLFIIALLQQRPTGSHSLPNYLHIKQGVATETQTINSTPPPQPPTPPRPLCCDSAATAASNWGCRIKLLTYDFPAIRFTHCHPLANVQHTPTGTQTDWVTATEGRDEVSRGRKDRESGDGEEHAHPLGLGVVLL